MSDAINGARACSYSYILGPKWGASGLVPQSAVSLFYRMIPGQTGDQVEAGLTGSSPVSHPTSSPCPAWHVGSPCKATATSVATKGAGDMPNPKPRNNKDGTTTWTVQYRIGERVTRDTFLTFEAADEYCRLIDTVGGAQAKTVLHARRSNKHTPTLREWVTTYLDADSGILTGVEDGTRDGYQREAARTFLQFLGDYPLDAITAANVGQWLAWQEKQTVWRDRSKDAEDRAPVSAKTIKNAHALLSASLASAVRHKHLPDNPAQGIRLPKGLKREAVFLSPAEFGTLLHFTPDRHKRFVMFLAGTGCRWGEATALTWGDVILHGKVPTIRITKAWKRGANGSSVLKHPKSSKSRRTVSLYPDLVAALGAPGDSDALVFPNTAGTRMQHSHFTARVWKKAVESAMDKEKCAEVGRPHLTRAPNIHDLRHTHASWMIAAGVPLPSIQSRLGHEKITTTVDVYGHLSPDVQEEMSFAIELTLGNANIPLPELESPGRG